MGLFWRRVFGEASEETLWSIDALANCYRHLGRYAEVEPLLREALAIRLNIDSGDRPGRASSLAELGMMLVDQGRHTDAEPLLREALTIRRGSNPVDQDGLASSLVMLGKMLVDQGRHTEAEPLLHECLEIRRSALSEGHWLTFNAMSLLGASLAGQDEYEEAEPLLLNGYHGMQDDPAALDLRKREALERIVTLYEAWGKPEKAQEYRALLLQHEKVLAHD